MKNNYNNCKTTKQQKQNTEKEKILKDYTTQKTKKRIS